MTFTMTNNYTEEILQERVNTLIARHRDEALRSISMNSPDTALRATFHNLHKTAFLNIDALSALLGDTESMAAKAYMRSYNSFMGSSYGPLDIVDSINERILYVESNVPRLATHPDFPAVLVASLFTFGKRSMTSLKNMQWEVIAEVICTIGLEEFAKYAMFNKSIDSIALASKYGIDAELSSML
jgi:hypothetical protein